MATGYTQLIVLDSEKYGNPNLQQETSDAKEGDDIIQGIAVELQYQNSGQKKLDENDEEIMFEGIYDLQALICAYGCAIPFLVIFTAGIVLLILPIIILVQCCNKASWKLYLTRNAIHHVYVPTNSGLMLCKRNWVIPLDDIKDIYVRGCSDDIAVQLGNSMIYKYIPKYYHYKIDNEDCLLIHNVKNREEFVAAVKKALTVTLE